MDEKNISFRNFFIPLFILVFSLLISACENTLPTETTIELSVDFETITNKRTRGINGNVTRIDHIKFAISDTQNNLLSKAELRASGSLSIVAPPGKRLILNASAYLKNTLLYEGNTQIPALSPGQNFQANFLMHDISDDSSDPVLVDVGLNSKPGNGVGQGTQFSQSSTNTNLETGRFILFKSSASNLTRNDNNGMEDLFVRDLVTGHIINVHTDSNGNTAKPGSTPSSLESDISLDGHYVVFASNSDNLVPEDKNNVSDIFIKDVFTNKITRINNSTDFPIESGSDFPGISHDGSIVVFFSQDKLTEDGGIGIYLFDRIGETLHFIIPAATEPQISGNGNRILYKRTSDNSLNVYDVVQKTHVSITEGTSDDILFRKAFNKNGAYVAFIPSESRSNYAAGHTYLFSVDENKLFLASANNDGTPLSISGKEESNPGLSDDGRYVTFEANGFIYIKEVESGLLNAISFGINPFISASGQHIGYTESTTGHVFYMSNLAYTGTATTAGNPTPIESSFIFQGEDLILSWDKIDDASYYRIYLRNTPFPEDLRIAGRDVQQIYETRDGSINLGKDLDYNRNYYYLITTVTPEGEFRNAPVIEFYYEGVKPILSNSSHFYRPNSSELQANVIGYDPFGQTISYTLVTPPTRGEIIVNTDGAFTYKITETSNSVVPVGNILHPAPHGTDYFTVKASDGEFESNEARVTIIFNNEPTIIPNEFTSSNNNIFAGTLIAKDNEQKSLYYELVSANATGVINLNSSGQFTFSPGVGEFDTVTFDYRVHDNFAYSETGTAIIDLAVSESCMNGRSIVLSKQFNVNQNASLVLVSGGENDAISGFVTERAAWKQTLQASPILLDENKVEDLIRNFETSANENSINLTRVSQRIGESKNHMVLEYIATKNDLVNSSPASYEALEISNFLASNIGLEIPPGTFPPGLGQTTAGNEFRIALSVLFQSDHSVVFAVAVVVEQEYDLNTSLMKGFTDSGSLSFCGTGIQSERQSFIAQDIKTNTADFLFVVDNSGSMSSYQNAVTSAADNFANVMLSAGLDFNIGIITTDSDAIRGGSFTNDINTFKNTMNSIGTSGDATETGIWFAEQSLKSTDSGSSFDGTVTLSGHPRPGSTLSVIILSDEPSQYTSRSGNAVFDVGNNLFVANGYRVYSIVNDSSASQYDELALVTGGAIASINNTLAFPQIMKDIAINAGGSASQFTLAHTPIGSTIVIKVNGNTATRSISDGWQYISLTNSIVFYGTAIPNVGDTVDIEYAWLDQKPTPPIALDAKYTSVNNQIIQGTVSAVDPNQDIIIEYAIVSSPTQGTLLFDNKGNFTYTPFTGSSGIDTFTFTARDKDGVSKSGTITFTLIENTPPQLTGDTLYGCYNEAEITNQFILSNAEDTDQISYFVIDVPTYGHVNISGDKYAYVADTTLTTVDSFSIRAFDGYGYSTTETFLVNVNTNCGKQRDTGFINLIGTNYTSNLPAPLSPHSMTYTPDSSATWSIGSDGLFSFLTSQTNPSLTIFEYETNYPAYNFSNTRNIYALVVDGAPTTAFGFESNEVDATSLLDFSESAAPWLVSSAQVYEGSFALESPPISDTAKAVVSTQITVPPTNTNVSGLSFAIRIGGQLFGSKLTLTIRDSNGLVVKNDTWNGNWEWHEMAYQLTPDTYTIKWSFENPNDDVDAKAWIDQVLVTAPQATP